MSDKNKQLIDYLGAWEDTSNSNTDSITCDDCGYDTDECECDTDE